MSTKTVVWNDLRADARTPAAGEGLVDADAASGLAVHPVEGARLEGPLEQARPRVTEGRVQRLTFAGAVAVEGDAEIVDADKGHTTSVTDCRLQPLYTLRYEQASCS